jgi:glycosyltransferase involved in cell wall biosynthesis
VILEAFSAGIPVIAFPCGGIPEVLDDQRTGFLTSEPTSEALASAISTVLRVNPAYLKHIVEQARDEWARRFTLESYQEHVTQLLIDASDAHGR